MGPLLTHPAHMRQPDPEELGGVVKYDLEGTQQFASQQSLSLFIQFLHFGIIGVSLQLGHTDIAPK